MSNPILWTAAEAAAATSGRAAGEWQATGVSIDTRTIKKGDLFVALKGDRGDGHDHVAKALAAGACAALVSRIPDGVDASAPLLMVRDTLEGLRDLARTARGRTGAKIIAVTGSVGKTGTKEMLLRAFGALGETHASRASYNNHWGVPYSLSSLPSGCDYGIFEIGMNHVGEITPLTKIVRPDIAIITTIAPVHLEHFESVEQIAYAKAEIFDGMDHNGTAILNIDNEWYALLAGVARARGLRVLSFGENKDADAALVDCLEAANGTRVKARIMGETVSFNLRVPGRHIALNALSVLLAVKAASGDLVRAAKGLEAMEPIAGRGLREQLNIGDIRNPVTLIDESYNASPASMRAAFRVLALVDPGRGGRRIAVLGDMLELGRESARLHAELALPLKAADVNLVYTCGPLMKNLYDALPPEQKGAHKSNSVDLAAIVPDVLTPGDVVMVKGSNGSKMGVVVEALRALPEKMRTDVKKG